MEWNFTWARFMPVWPDVCLCILGPNFIILKRIYSPFGKFYLNIIISIRLWVYSTREVYPIWICGRDDRSKYPEKFHTPVALFLFINEIQFMFLNALIFFAFNLRQTHLLHQRFFHFLFVSNRTKSNYALLCVYMWSLKYIFPDP